MLRPIEIALAYFHCNGWLLLRLLRMQKPVCSCYMFHDKKEGITRIVAGHPGHFGKLNIEKVFYDMHRVPADKTRGITRTVTLKPDDWKVKGAGSDKHFACIWTAPKEWVAEGFDTRKAAFDPIPREFLGRTQVQFVAKEPMDLSVQVAW